MAAPPSGLQSQSSGDWAISQQEKTQFDNLFAKVDVDNRGFVTGDQAVGFFSNSKLPEEDLAQIWDLADINSEGQLNRDEFAVAMHLIRQQLGQKNLTRKTPLPQSLPANLVPPSMRRQPTAPPQSTAPTFENAANIAKPKSAADDLFGLDAFSAPAPQVAQSTGGSTTYTPTSPQPTGSSPQTQSAQQSSVFKPFVPSSSFGQNMMTPQGTGSSRALQNQQAHHPNADDLLGDNDPEVSKRLTQETTDLANLSNQVGTLTTQMQQVKSKRASTQEDLSQVNKQKRDFEARLSQLRSAYEQEAREVKALEERLVGSRNETRKLQQDLAMVQHTHQNLQAEHQQVAVALEADQKEIASLKEKMRQVNNEIGQLKPQLEKTRSDARQQKGLVVINKKQLSTIEAEREKAKNDLAGATREMEEATRELEETHRSLQAAPRAQVPAPMATPTPSTTSQSMNPFFRRGTTSSDRGLSQPVVSPPTAASPNLNAFDSFFGPPIFTPSPFTAQESSHAPQPTSRTDSPEQPRQVSGLPEPSTRSIDSPEQVSVQTPVTSSPPSVHDGLPSSSALPPPPPQSRQITSSFLPLKDSIPRSGSPNSSVGVAPPASRFGDLSGIDTPTNERTSSGTFPQSQDTGPSEKADTSQAKSSATPGVSSTQDSIPLSETLSSNKPPEIGTSAANESFREIGQPSAPPDIPGSFPGDSTPFHTPLNTSGILEAPPPNQSQSPIESLAIHSDEPFGAKSDSRDPASAKEDFDAAFEGFGNKGKDKGKEPEPRGQGFPADALDQAAPRVAGGEFPPIQEFGADDDSDSSSDRGFQDNFTAASPPRHQRDISHESGMTNQSLYGASDTSAAGVTGLPRPGFDREISNSSQLPTPNAQASPPTYDQTVSPNGVTKGPRDSNQFPAEYGGLLPSREPVTSPPESAIRSPSDGDRNSPFFGSPVARDRAVSGSSISSSRMPMPFGATAAPYAYNNVPISSEPSSSHNQPPIPPKNAFDDFENEFGDLSEAQAADDKVEDEFAASQQADFDEFNPTFDSPPPSKATASSVNQDANAFHDFESSISSSAQQSTSRQTAPTAAVNHDWDAMFAGLDGGSSQTNGDGARDPAIPPKEAIGSNFEVAAKDSEVAAKPMLGRTLTTEHDDPILKRLTGMGYPRDASLDALEKFDYNLDKACGS